MEIKVFGRTLKIRDVDIIYAFKGGCYAAKMSAPYVKMLHPKVGEMLMIRPLARVASKGRRAFNKEKDLYWWWMHCWVVAIGEDGTVVCGFGRTYNLALNSIEVVAP